MDERYYIVRSYEAGVFFGQITARTGNEVTMRNVRKLWYWEGACAVEQLAMEGVKAPSACKFTVVVDEITILNVCQFAPCTEAAAANLRSVSEWKRQ